MMMYVTHNVYYATHRNTIVYIGSGQLTRYRHCNSGMSHVKGLNYLYFTEPDTLQTHILSEHTSAEAALEYEYKMIELFKPVFNVAGNSDATRKAIRYDNIEYTDNAHKILQYTCLFDVEPKQRTRRVKKPSVQSLVTEYNDIMSSYRENPEFLTSLECFLTTNTTFSEWLDCGVTPQNMNSLNSRDKIDTLARSLKMLVKVDSVELPFVVGVKYTVADIKSKLQTYYDKNNIQMKVKGTDIKRFYNVSKVCESGVNYFKIISKL